MHLKEKTIVSTKQNSVKPGLLAKSLPWFEEWRQRKAEPIPDFNALPRISDLPPLLEFSDGRKVVTLQDWEQRRTEIANQLCRYFLGSFPARPPPLTKTHIVQEDQEQGAVRRLIELTFGVAPAARMLVETITPHGKGPFPVFMTQKTHRSWGMLALSRGYLVCAYPAADRDDQSENFIPLYPECDWATIPRRAWSAGRALDYLATLPEVDQARIGIAGHSRNGKQSLIAAAFDPRIAAVVSSSSGSGGACPYRLSKEPTAAESVEVTTRFCPGWYHPRIRFFTGCEDRLPMDMHGLPALIAPRHVLFSTAYNDDVEPYPSVERCYLAGREVYRFLGKPEHFRIRWRPGNHETNAEDIQSYLDFFDLAFGRGAAVFPERLLYHFNWPQWREKAGAAGNSFEVKPGTAPARKQIKERVLWGLGGPPPTGVQYAGTYGKEPEHVAVRLQRPPDPEGVARVRFDFSDYVRGDLYFPENAEGVLPTVIWLHPYAFAHGYSAGPWDYYNDESNPYHWIAQQGFAVLAFDQLGFGGRILEGANFYERYPRWSKLGKMVRDVQAAVNVIAEGTERLATSLDRKFLPDLPLLDPYRVFCLGYALGGVVGLYAAALDERIAGVASFCGFAPMRIPSKGRQAGMLERLCSWHGLQPRLGYFKGRENELPYHFEDVLSLIAPRSCLISAPVYDCDADHGDVGVCVAKARPAWQKCGAPDNLTLIEPEDYNRFQSDQYAIFMRWFTQALEKFVAPGAGKKPWFDRALAEHKIMRSIKNQPPPCARVPLMKDRSPAGNPSKVEWSRVESPFTWHTIMGHTVSRKIDLRLAHDGAFLYIQLADHLDTSKLVTGLSVWGGDDWEIFFAPQRGHKPYHQVGINPLGGHIALAYGETSAWDCGATVISDVTGDCWKVSLAFPLDKLLPGGVKVGQPFFANFYRSSPRVNEMPAWSPNFEPSAHALNRLGEIILVE